MMTGRAWCLVLGMAAIGVSGGCKRAAKALAEKAHAVQEQHAAEQAKQQVAEDPAHVSVGHYNKGFNLLIDDPQAVVEEYFSKVPEEGPEPGEKYLLMPKHSFAETDIAEIKSAFAEGDKIAPASLKHLAPLASASVSDIEKVLTAFKAAHEYWSSSEPQADKGAKGKALHVEFVKASDAYTQSVKKFEAALSVIEDQQMAEELKAYEKDKSYGYWFRLHNQRANKLLKADKASFAAPFSELEQAHAGFLAFAGGKPDAHAAFKSYQTQSERFMAAAKKLKAAHEQEKPDEEAIDEARGNTIDAYNAMIDVSNSLRELEGNGLLK